MIHSLGILTISLLLTAPSGDGEALPQLVADELVHLPPGEVAEAWVIARYGARVGSRLEVEGSERSFLIGPEAEGEPLARAKARRGLMRLRVAFTDTENLEIREVHSAPPPLGVFRMLSAPTRSRGTERTEALLRWALRESGRGDPQLREEATRSWRAHAQRRLADGAETALHWLEFPAPMVGEDPRWLDFANALARRFPADPQVEAGLAAAGLTANAGRWLPRAAFLRERGLVEQQGRVVPIGRVALAKAIESWSRERRRASLLRGKTRGHYERRVSAGEVIEGMTHDEIIQAWGYPPEVTWERRGERIFEAWIYGAGSIYLVEGLVFLVE